MIEQTIDRKLLKAAVLELMTERKDFFKGILREILAENHVIISQEQAERRARLEAFISEDFDRYDEVFKALAYEKRLQVLNELAAHLEEKEDFDAYFKEFEESRKDRPLPFREG